MSHKVKIWSERNGNEWRATCECGWMEKAWTKPEIDARIAQHKRYPHR